MKYKKSNFKISINFISYGLGLFFALYPLIAYCVVISQNVVMTLNKLKQKNWFDNLLAYWGWNRNESSMLIIIFKANY